MEVHPGKGLPCCPASSKCTPLGMPNVSPGLPGIGGSRAWEGTRDARRSLWLPSNWASWRLQLHVVPVRLWGGAWVWIPCTCVLGKVCGTIGVEQEHSLGMRMSHRGLPASAAGGHRREPAMHSTLSSSLPTGQACSLSYNRACSVIRGEGGRGSHGRASWERAGAPSPSREGGRGGAGRANGSRRLPGSSGWRAWKRPAMHSSPSSFLPKDKLAGSVTTVPVRS